MNRRSRGRYGWLQKLWEGVQWYAGLPGYYAGQVWQFLARGWRRRFQKAWQGLLWYLGLPFFLLGRGLRRSTRLLAWRWNSHRFRYLLQGLPALLLGAGAVVMVLFLWLTPETQAVDSYFREGSRRFQEKDYDAAQVCFERLTQLNPDRPEYRYRLALTSAALGQIDRASALMDKLAPPDQQGYPPAHLQQARGLLAVAGSVPQALVTAEKHLRRVLQADPESLEAHLLLGRVCLVTGRYDEAEVHLLKAVPAQPELRFELAQVYALRNNKEEARQQAKQAIQYFRTQAQANMDNVAARLNWARTLMFLEDFRAAIKVLEEAQHLTPRPEYRAGLMQAYLTWADTEARDPKASTAKRLELLEQALHYDPDSVAVAQRLLALSRVKGEQADKARGIVQGLLAEGKSPATLHVLLGMDAWERGKMDEAKQHLEQAYRLSPQAALVANNLAWALAFSEPTDLPRALELSNSVVQRWPTQLRFRDTRGQILAKMGRWKDAVVDLEAALPALPNPRDAHRTLAKVYQELGNPELAAEHQRLAEAKAP